MDQRSRNRLTLSLAGALALVGVLIWMNADPSAPDLEPHGDRQAAVALDETPTDPLKPAPGRESRHDAGRVVEPDTPAGESGSQPHVLLFTDPQGVPVASVSVLEPGAVVPELVGESDGSGRFELHGEVDRSMRLVACHPDYLVAELSPSGLGGPPQVVVLDPGSSIRGSVLFPDGFADVDSVRVLAAPFGRLPSAAQVESLLERGWSPAGATRVVQVDASGRFTLRGLTAGRSYYVTAGGSQCLARSGFEGIEPTEDHVELELDWLHGVRTRLVQAKGPLQVSPTVRHPRGIQTTMNGVLPPYRNWEAGLARIPSVELDVPSAHESVFLALGGTRAELGELMKLDASVPGFERVTRFVELPPAAHHVPIEDVVLTPSGGGWSTLVVEIVGGSPGPSETPETELPAGTLVLSDAGGPRCEVRLQSLARGSTTRHDVPSGHYQASFLATAGSYRWPRPPDTIRLDLTGDVATLSIPLGECGGLQVTLVDRDGQPFEGRTIVRLSRGGSSRYTHTRFWSSPFSFEALPPGDYRVAALVGPSFLPPGREPYQGEVEVRAGERSTLTLEHR